MIEPPWLTIAMAEIGTKEVPGEGDHPRIVEYHMSVDDVPTPDKIAWCSSFVNWCMGMAGFEGTGSRAARSWLRWGIPLATPAYGCVCILWRVSPSSWQGHVGFPVNIGPDWIEMVGGNQSNAVNIKRYPRDRVLGYRWVK